MNQATLIFVPETHSTNNLLAEIAHEKLLQNSCLEDFTLLYTDYQNSGRGLIDNVWHSNPKENILMSLYFRLSIPPQKQFFFNMFFALSVRALLTPYIDNVKIKWPNDVYVGDKKIAGILIEHTIQGKCLSQTIAGVGININQCHFPIEVPNPTSLKLETGQEYDIPALLQEYITNAQPYYNLLLNNEYDLLSDEYYKYMYGLNEYHTYIIRQQKVRAAICGVNEYGQLLLKDEVGEGYCCGYKEVRGELRVEN